jgi:flavodoxin I
MKTLVIYGSTTGTTEGVAEQIAQKLGAEAVNVADVTDEQIAEADNLILGSSTWGAGELQDDWYDGLEKLKAADLSGKIIAIFGVGDSASYSDTFCGSMAELYHGLEDSGAQIVGAVPTDGYTFDDSESVVDGKFVGLPIDEENESDKTEERIDNWVKEIKPSLK